MVGGEARQGRDSCAKGRGGGERGNPGSSLSYGSARAAFLLPRDPAVVSLVVVRDRNLDSEASCRELAWRFRSFIGGKREKKMPLHLILSPGTAEGLS